MLHSLICHAVVCGIFLLPIIIIIKRTQKNLQEFDW
jgi:hypothetical protein